MPSFQSRFGEASVLVDDRSNIGPHHLAIGKTRKLFEAGDVIEAFYSEGYRIGHARLDAETLALRSSAALGGIPIAWGGGAFCIDNDNGGQVTLVFVHRNRHEFCAVRGQRSDDGIKWGDWQVLLETSSPQAAPWVEVGPDGSAWCSVLARDGNFGLAIIDPDGRQSVAPLFAPDETPWYHSCVQVLPISADEAVAVGFRGAFPTKTELVFKTVSRGLKTGPSKTLAPCNVNDQFTFHFQAVGDAARGRAHIAYLDDGLSVSHAVYAGGAWQVHQGVMPFPAYAPQICLDEAGQLALLACDYEGAIWTASWSQDEGWTPPRLVEGLPANTISGQFGRTGYGTGGLISAARSHSGRVPFLMGIIADEKTGRASLYAGSLGRGSGLMLDADAPVSATMAGPKLKGEIRLQSLRKQDFGHGKSWTLCVPRRSGTPVRFIVEAQDGRPALRLEHRDAGGQLHSAAVPAKITTRFHEPFSQVRGFAAIAFEAEYAGALQLLPEKAWAETYHRAAGQQTLCDIAPFEPEAAAQTALAPYRIPVIYKRMV